MSTQSQKNNEQILILNGKLKLLDQKIDLLMNTVSADHEVSHYLSLLHYNGTIV